jgi:hypothetical protein
MQSADIKGNKPGSRNLGNFHSRERKEFRKTGQNGDIVGTNVGSLQLGIKQREGSKARVINPLDPVYQIPGNTEAKVDLMNDPYGMKGCSLLNIGYNQSKGRPQTALPPRPPIPGSAAKK